MLARVHTPPSPMRERERERKKEGGREMQNMVIAFISLLLTVAALQIKNLNDFLTV